MTKEELAEKLDGQMYGSEISSELADEAAEYGLVAIFGASDDLVELRGAVDDELSAYNGTVFYMTPGGLPENTCPSGDECPHFKERCKSFGKVEAVWCGTEGNVAWTYKTDIPHAEFNILEDSGVYCRGIVLSLRDLN